MEGFFQLPPVMAVAGVSAGLIGGAVALGIRHGIDWDHIAAITDITSTSASAPSARESILVNEPGVMLTDESHHGLAEEGWPEEERLRSHGHAHVTAANRAVSTVSRDVSGATVGGVAVAVALQAPPASTAQAMVREQSRPVFLGSMYALGHATVVTLLGLLAIVAAGVLPDWIDPVMERVVGVTLILLSLYLFASIYRFFRGEGEFRIRSRWMLIFAGVRNGVGWLRARISGDENHHHHVHEAQDYGWKTAYGIGLIHGVGAETGTQALIIAAAAGASTKTSSVVVLLAFVVGLLISNSVVTIMSTSGFATAGRRQWVYVAAGLIAAVFSLVVGVIFLAQSGGILPDPGGHFRWIGGPD